MLRSYDDTRLSLPGLALTFRPHRHQVAAVARIISEPAVLLAHEVGAGKTAEMIMGVTELRRLGLVRKPAVVIPNHMLEQFTREWLQLYPQAKVMVAGQEDLQRDRRREFTARCATGTWDGIVMSRSAFERIPLSAPEQQAYMDRELDQLRDWIAAAKKGDGISVKKLEKILLRAQERIRGKLDSAKDPGITFEATGIDYLCIDEAHGYKNLRTPSNISDAAIDGSMRASDLDMKIGYLRRRNGRRVVTFATATPIANSVTEAYVMQRYLRPDLLEAAGIEVFDSWAATFGQVVSQVELAPEGGSSFRMKSRFARFANVPEMLRMLHVAADVKTADDLNLPVPALRQRPDGRRAAETVTVEPSQELLGYVRDLGDRAAQVRNRAVGPDEDNMLKISGDGRRAALDMRLLGLPQTTPGKIAAAAGRIAAIWKTRRDDEYFDPDGIPYPGRGSLQLVFCDLGTPGPGWNAYGELRGQLVARGLPAQAIQFIHDAKTDRDKARLFAACRTGAVAVLIGSTEKMGVGTNVQDRAIALHHLDAPWRPADVAQREGRIIRQGNLNRQLGRDIEIIRYVTAQSFDGYMWQTLERKARFIHQVMHGRLDTREITDIGDTALSFSEVKAIATGNPLLIDKAEADTALARLQRAERAHQRNQQALRNTVTGFETEISRLTALAAAIDTAITQRQDTRGEKFSMTVGGTQHTKRADAGQHAKDILARETAALTGQLRRAATIGRLAGFAVNAELSRTLGATNVTITLDGAPGTTIEIPASGLPDADPARLVTRLEHRLAQLETRKADALAEIDHARRQIAHARASIGEQFPHAEELAAASQRVREIDEALDRMAQQQPDHAATTEQAIPSADSRQQAEAQRAGAVAGTAHQAAPRSAHDFAAQREQDARQPAAAQVGNSGRTQANRAAVAANDAYKAGDLDRARDLTEQAAALDPSRAGLWQQHRNDIAARQLIISAQAAHADGDRERADKLLQDARQLDPRLRTLWDGSPLAQPAAQLTRQAPGSGTTAPEASDACDTGRMAATAQPEERAPQPGWPSAPPRREPDRAGLAAAQPGGTQPAAQSSAGTAGPREPPAAASGSTEDPDADSGGDAARWPSRNPRSQSPAAARPRAADRDARTAPQAAAESSRQSPAAPAARPSADWRDQILSDARQPWQPGPSWPHHPAIHQTPQAATPDAGISPDAEP